MIIGLLVFDGQKTCFLAKKIVWDELMAMVDARVRISLQGMLGRSNLQLWCSSAGELWQ